jgi:hypothetical protein
VFLLIVKGGGGVITPTSVGEVWMFSGMTQISIYRAYVIICNIKPCQTYTKSWHFIYISHINDNLCSIFYSGNILSNHIPYHADK